MKIKRRQFLKITAASVGGLMIRPPRLAALDLLPGGGPAAAEPQWWRKTLVLIELRGGNDGLNMVVPFADPVYYRLRPELAVPRENVLALDDGLGLAPACAPLAEIWKRGELAVVLGVGYPQPNRSHFRSIDIWETGSSSDRVLETGWIARLFSRSRPPKELLADALVLGRDDAGPMRGAGMRNIVLDDPRSFVRDAASLGEPAARRATGVVETHLAAVQTDTVRAARGLEEFLRKAPKIDARFPQAEIGRQLGNAVALLGAGMEIPVLKLTLGGFDTHSGQKAQQERLLGELAGSLAAFRESLVALGLWDRVLVVTYSEFGRRARENASRGTDHGTAAAHFVLGGTVRGGLYGRQPSLEDLDEGDMKHTTDFRSLYITIARRWWGLGGDFLEGGPFPEIPLLR